MASPAELKERLEVEAAGRPYLFFRAPSGQQVVVLEPQRERVTVGRGNSVDVALDHDSEVSWLHAELERIAEQWTVRDDGLSRNGSFLNGERVSGRRRLRDRDELRFGGTVVVYRDPAEDARDETLAADDLSAISLTDTQRRVLVALCRPFREGSSYAIPATNPEIANEAHLSVDAVKGHLRVLFEKLGIAELPQNQKRIRLVELSLRGGLISVRDLE